MTIGIYCIMHFPSGKRYVGKSVNIEARLTQHKYNLAQPIFDQKKCNRHLWNAVQKYGWDQFETWVIESFDEIDEALIAERELYWMDALRTCERPFGYNLRRDSRTKMIVHEETRFLMSSRRRGENNPNFGKKRSPEERQRMSEGRRAKSGYNSEQLALRSRSNWSDPTFREKMLPIVREVGKKYIYVQLSEHGALIRIWSGVKEIEDSNLGFTRLGVYSVCNGRTKAHRGFKWAKLHKSVAFDCIWAFVL